MLEAFCNIQKSIHDDMTETPAKRLVWMTACRAGCAAAGWIIGFATYMIAMMMTVYDGMTSFILQPIMGAIITTITLGACLIVGLVFHIPRVGRMWRKLWPVALLLAIGSVLLMCFGSTWGMATVFTDPETGQQITGLRPDVGISSYVVLVFAIANWPLSFKPPEKSVSPASAAA